MKKKIVIAFTWLLLAITVFFGCVGCGGDSAIVPETEVMGQEESESRGIETAEPAESLQESDSDSSVGSGETESSGGEEPVLEFKTVSAEDVNRFDPSAIRLFGRTYLEENGNLRVDHVTSGFECSFFGTELRASLFVSGMVYVRVWVDGVPCLDEETGEDCIRLWSDPRTVLAEGLEEGVHTVRLLKISEPTDGRLTVKKLQAEQFLKSTLEPMLNIEFIGDSITAGYGVLGTTEDVRTPGNSDSCRSYAYLTVQELEQYGSVDFSVVALSGICTNVHMWQENDKMSELYLRESLFTDTAYEFRDDVDVVVVNLGTNEASYLELRDSAYGNRFPQDYAEFLRCIRQNRPHAKILCLYGMMGKNPVVDSGIRQAVESLEDPEVLYLSDILDFPADGSGAGGHPSEAAQAQAARILAAYLMGER